MRDTWRTGDWQSNQRGKLSSGGEEHEQNVSHAAVAIIRFRMTCRERQLGPAQAAAWASDAGLVGCAVAGVTATGLMSSVVEAAWGASLDS